MRRIKVLGCCTVCDRYERWMKLTRKGARKHRQIMRMYSRRLRRVNQQALRNGDFEATPITGERWF
jgi:hypothetical protein